MFWNRKDEDDEYQRYMEERDRERGSDFSDRSYESSGYIEPVNDETHHEYNFGEEPCEYGRNAQDFEKASRAVQRHLYQGERIVWAGTGVANDDKGSAVVQKVFGIFWLAFSIFWVVGAFSSAGVFGLFGVPFVIIGIGIVFGKANNVVCYAVTDNRVIVKSGRGTSTIMLNQISNPRLIPLSQDLYNVTFNSTVPVNNYGNFGMGNGFFNIKDGEAAYKALNDGIYVNKT
ncbi:MAG: DUF308 domain-containing protein [Oscillospiraceae bacterium]|nr:DUF308 domain-containing protein [Oscillospiraceae bacterium]